MSTLAPSESSLPAFLRLFWMLVGNAVIVLTALVVARMPPWTFSWRDVIYAVAVVGLVWSRWIDATRYGGTSAQGEEMTRPMLMRWIAVALALTTGLWLLAQSLEL
jgi:hypothetical protein